MKTHTLHGIVALALGAGASSIAQAADQEHPWSLSVSGGDAFGVTGSLRESSLTTLDDLGTLDPALTGADGSVSIDRVRYEDVFRRRHDLGVELGYTFNDKVEGFGRVSYDSLNGRSVRIGALSSDALPDAHSVDADFGNAYAWGLELGARYYLPTGASWHPYAGAALGVTRMDGITATVDVPDTAIDLQQVQFTRRANVFSQSLEAGLEYAPSEDFALRFALDADHMGSLRPNDADPGLTALGIDTTHDADSRWSFPLMLTASYHFG